MATTDNGEVQQQFAVPDNLKARCIRQYGWREDFADAALIGYQQFIKLKMRLDDWDAMILSPSLTVDLVWHQHILDVQHYVTACEDYCGQLIGHNPDGELDTEGREERIKTTRLTLRALYGSQVDETIWLFGNNASRSDSNDSIEDDDSDTEEACKAEKKRKKKKKDDSDDDEESSPKKKKSKKKDPNAPKRGFSAFMFYSQEVREKEKEIDPSLSFGEIGKLIGKKWKELSTEDRAKYEEMAAKDRERYLNDMKSYVPPASSGKGSATKKKKDPNAPKRAMTSFFHFSTKMRPIIKQENPDLSFGELGKKLGELFRALSPEEKEKYENLAKKDQERYKKEAAEYKSKKSNDEEAGNDDDDDGSDSEKEEAGDGSDDGSDDDDEDDDDSDDE